jgi:Lrp/AsnC family transcriptional regulator, leucine-responsive regulatory protein
MIKLDSKDRRILYELDVDSRQTVTQIGAKIDQSKEVVSYRVRKLKERGIIKNYYTVIDASKLGYVSFRIYLIYQHVTPKIEKEIIKYFVKNKYTWLVCSLKGTYDLDVIVWVKETSEFYSFWKKTLQKYCKYFQKQVFSIYNQSFTYRNSFLLLDEYEEADRGRPEIVGGGKRVVIDELNFQILKILSEDARITTKKIAKKLNSTAITIGRRIEKLIKLDVIQGFRVNIHLSKLDYHFYKAEVTLANYEKREDIIEYITLNPHLTMIDESAGIVDLEVDFIVENVNQFYHIMEDLITKFPNAIQNYTYYYVSKIHKLKYIPEIQ